jgi:capsid protein
MQKYDSNFSASRAALKDWEHSLTVLRQRFVNGYHVYVYQYWFDVQVRLGKVVAPQYIAAKSMGNYIITESYTRARWVGAQVPHIDPVKEVQAERLKLGANMASAPLTTLEAATERLNGGDSVSNMEQFADELQTAKNLGIETSGTADPRRSTREVNED